MKKLEELRSAYLLAHTRKLNAFKVVETKLHKGLKVTDEVDGKCRYIDRIIELEELEEVLNVIAPNEFEELRDYRDMMDRKYNG